MAFGTQLSASEQWRRTITSRFFPNRAISSFRAESHARPFPRGRRHLRGRDPGDDRGRGRLEAGHCIRPHLRTCSPCNSPASHRRRRTAALSGEAAQRQGWPGQRERTGLPGRPATSALGGGRRLRGGDESNYRAFAVYAEAKALADDGTLGKITTISARAHYACWSHCIDLIGLFAGPIESVTSVRGDILRSGAGMDAVDLGIAFRSHAGAVGTLLGSAGSPWGHPLIDLSLEFEGGRVLVSDLDGSLTIYRRDDAYVESRRLSGHHSRWDRYAQSFRTALAEYLDSVRTGFPPPVPAMAGLRSSSLRQLCVVRRMDSAHALNSIETFR